MSTTTQDSLALRVNRVIAEEDQRAAERCQREPSGSRATRREEDMRLWGMTYGIALGLQIGADPESDLDTAAEDALDAARAAYARWAPPIAQRVSYSPVLDEMLMAYHRVEVEIDRALMDSVDGRAFLEAMQGLREAIGMPEPAVVQ
jgi:hypothetical protein